MSLDERIKNVAQAYLSMHEKKKMDPVDKDELKGKHADRDDKDIDNDGDVDSSDKYLHKKRQAISKAKGEAVEIEVEKDSEASPEMKKKPVPKGKAKAKKKVDDKMLWEYLFSDEFSDEDEIRSIINEFLLQ